MRTDASPEIMVQGPANAEEAGELARRLAEVHADFVIQTIGCLHCPLRQKRALLQAVIDTAKGLYRTSEQPAAAPKGPEEVLP